MPMPRPNKNEAKQDFINRFMGDKNMVKEYPDESQRYAVALSQYEKRHKKMSEHLWNFDDAEEEYDA